MKRWLPHPMLSAVLLLLWLLLNDSFALAHWLLGAALAIALPRLLHGLLPRPRRIHKPVLLCRFLARVLRDIAVANITVARLILGPNARLQPALVEFPLELGDDMAIALLASAISLAPGTVSADLSEDRRTLLIHVLHLTDREQLIAEIKQRYERPLREIFAC